MPQAIRDRGTVGVLAIGMSVQCHSSTRLGGPLQVLVGLVRHDAAISKRRGRRAKLGIQL